MKKSQVNRKISKKAESVFELNRLEIEEKLSVSNQEEKGNSTKRRPRTWMFNVSERNYRRIEFGFKRFMVVANKYDIREGDLYIMVRTGKSEIADECVEVGTIKNVETVLEMFDFKGVIVFNW